MIWFYSQNQKRSSDFFRNVMSCRIELCEKARKNGNKNGIWSGHALSSSYAILFFRDIYWISLCKSNEAFAELNTAERLYTFDVQYDRWNLSFTELYLNIFVNLIGQKESEKVSLSIDKESFFEIYEINWVLKVRHLEPKTFVHRFILRWPVVRGIKNVR